MIESLQELADTHQIDLSKVLDETDFRPDSYPALFSLSLQSLADCANDAEATLLLPDSFQVYGTKSFDILLRNTIGALDPISAQVILLELAEAGWSIENNPVPMS